MNKKLNAIVSQTIGILAAVCGLITIGIGIYAGYGVSLMNILVVAFGVLFFLMGTFQKRREKEKDDGK